MFYIFLDFFNVFFFWRTTGLKICNFCEKLSYRKVMDFLKRHLIKERGLKNEDISTQNLGFLMNFLKATLKKISWIFRYFLRITGPKKCFAFRNMFLATFCIMDSAMLLYVCLRKSHRFLGIFSRTSWLKIMFSYKFNGKTVWHFFKQFFLI